MLIWLFVVMALALFQIIGTYFFLPPVYLFTSNLLILLSALGMVYRVYKKQQVAYIETLEAKIDELEKKYSELKGE